MTHVSDYEIYIGVYRDPEAPKVVQDMAKNVAEVMIGKHGGTVTSVTIWESAYILRAEFPETCDMEKTTAAVLRECPCSSLVDPNEIPACANSLEALLLNGGNGTVN